MKQLENSKKVYMTPMLEVMNARVEKGFAGSGDHLVDPEESVNPSGTHTGQFDMD